MTCALWAGRKPVGGGRMKTPSAWELGVEGVGEIVGFGGAGLNVHLTPGTKTGRFLQCARDARCLGCLKCKTVHILVT